MTTPPTPFYQHNFFFRGFMMNQQHRPEDLFPYVDLLRRNRPNGVIRSPLPDHAER